MVSYEHLVLMDEMINQIKSIYTFALFTELAYAVGRNADFMRFYGIRPNFCPILQSRTKQAFTKNCESNTTWKVMHVLEH